MKEGTDGPGGPAAGALKRRKPSHPMQPVVLAKDGVVRFKQNKIIDWLFMTGKLSLNDIAYLDFPAEDRMQVAQLLGYSVSGYGELPYASRRSIEEANRETELLLARQPTPPSQEPPEEPAPE